MSHYERTFKQLQQKLVTAKSMESEVRSGSCPDSPTSLAAPVDLSAGGHGQSYSDQTDRRSEGETQEGGGEGGCKVSCFTSTTTIPALTQVSELTFKVPDLKT